MNRLTVRSAVRKYALAHAANVKKLSTGKPRFTRVSDEWLDKMEARLHVAIQSEVERLPSNGRTII